MRMMKILLLMFLCVVMSKLIPLTAQESSDKKQLEEYEKFNKKVNERARQLNKKVDEKFAEIQSKVDKEFVEILNKTWEKMKLYSGIIPDKKPKPVYMPVARPPEIPEEKIQRESEDRKVEPPLTLPKTRTKEKQIYSKKYDGETSSFVFFNTPLHITYDRGLIITIDGNVTKEKISDYWERMSKSDCQNCLE